MKVLVACEESQRVCIEFRKKGHEAYSCDTQLCSGKEPQWHIQSNVLPLINGKCQFKTLDEKKHNISNRWDMIIAFPPCTYLSKVGASNLFDRKHRIKNPERERKGWDAKIFFETILAADCEKIAVENPVPMTYFKLPKYNQIIEPYMFGDPWRKRTCLWLKGLPPLMATEIVIPEGLWVDTTSSKNSQYILTGHRNSKQRSKTFPGIAKAMAQQWG